MNIPIDFIDALRQHFQEEVSVWGSELQKAAKTAFDKSVLDIILEEANKPVIVGARPSSREMLYYHT